MNTCKANLIQHSSAVARNSRLAIKAGGWGMVTTTPGGQSTLNHQAQISSSLSIVRPALSPLEGSEVALYFRMECEACRPQCPSTSLKSMVRLDGNVLDRNQWKTLFQQRAGKGSTATTARTQTFWSLHFGFLGQTCILTCNVQSKRAVQAGRGGVQIWNATNAQSQNIWKYMAQFIFIVAINWQLIWIISTLCKGENITYGLTYCTQGLRGPTSFILCCKYSGS